MHLRDELLEMERRFWSAAGDGDFYRQHMADDGVCLLPVGVFDKAATIEAISGAPPWTSFELHDPQVVPLGGDAAALCYRAEADRDGVPYRAAIATTYRRNGDGWQLVVHQQTPLA